MTRSIPPYNTGGDFIYPDNYAEGLGSYLTYLGQVKDGIKQNGKTTMKAFGGKLTDDEIKALVAYVRSLKK